MHMELPARLFFLVLWRSAHGHPFNSCVKHSSCVTHSTEVELPPELREWGVRNLGAKRLAALIGNSTAVHTTMQFQFAHVSASSAKRRVVFHVSSLDKFGVAKLRGDLTLGGPNGHYNLTGFSTLVDVGANVGIVSILAWLYRSTMPDRPCLRVLAIEPTPETFLFLKLNLYVNRVPESAVCGVTALNVAMGARPNTTRATIVIGDRSMNAKDDSAVDGFLDPAYHAWKRLQAARAEARTARQHGSKREPSVERQADDSVQYSVATSTLRSLLDEHQMDTVGFLKVRRHAATTV